MAELEIIAPTANNVGGLGANDRKWKDVYAKNGSIETLSSTSITTTNITATKLVADSIVNSKGESTGGLNIIARSKAYAEGDIAYSSKLPSWGYLLCTTAGTTKATEVDFSTLDEGDTVADGTAVWTLKRMGSGGSGESSIDGEFDFAGIAGATVTHNLGNTDYVVMVEAAEDTEGDLGDVHVLLTENTFTVVNTGGFTGLGHYHLVK